MSTLNFLSSLSLGFLLTAQHGFNYSPRLSSVPLMPDSAPLVAQASSLPPISKVEYHFSQTEAWYPISPTANPVKGQTPTASIVSSKLLSEAEKRNLIAVWRASGLAFQNTPCQPISP